MTRWPSSIPVGFWRVRLPPRVRVKVLALLASTAIEGPSVSARTWLVLTAPVWLLTEVTAPANPPVVISRDMPPGCTVRAIGADGESWTTGCW